MRTTKNLTGWALVAAFAIMGCALLMMILGEAGRGTNIFHVVAIKSAALLLAYAEYKAAKWCYRRGLIPKGFIKLMRMFTTENGKCYE